MAAAHASASSSSRVTLVCSNRVTAASGRRPLTWTAPSACLDEYACAEWGTAVGYVGWHNAFIEANTSVRVHVHRTNRVTVQLCDQGGSLLRKARGAMTPVLPGDAPSAEPFRAGRGARVAVGTQAVMRRCPRPAHTEFGRPQHNCNRTQEQTDAENLGRAKEAGEANIAEGVDKQPHGMAARKGYACRVHRVRRGLGSAR
jgi:hypothetical protein